MNRSLKPGTLLIILTALNFLNYFDRFILASVAESVGKHFSLDDTEIGTLSTAFMLGYFITSPFFGYLGDRMQRKWLIAFGILIWSLATFLTGYAASYNQLILYRVFVGLGEASYATVSPALIADNFSEDKRNKALTIFYVAIPLGAAFGTLFGSWIGENYGWQKAFMLAGLPGLLFAFSLLPFREKSAESPGGKFNKPTLREIIGLLKIKNYNLVVWGYVAYAFALGAYQYWGQIFLQRAHKLTASSAGTFLGGVMVITGLLGTFIGGNLGSKLHKSESSGYAKLCSYSVFIAFPFCVLFTFSGSTIITQIALTLAMFFIFMPTGPVNTIILESVPSNLRSSAMAISIFAIHAFGDLWSPLIVGGISDYFSDIRFGLAILLPAIFICAVLWWHLARNNTRHSYRIT